MWLLYCIIVDFFPLVACWAVPSCDCHRTGIGCYVHCYIKPCDSCMVAGTYWIWMEGIAGHSSLLCLCTSDPDYFKYSVPFFLPCRPLPILGALLTISSKRQDCLFLIFFFSCLFYWHRPRSWHQTNFSSQGWPWTTSCFCFPTSVIAGLSHHAWILIVT